MSSKKRKIADKISKAKREYKMEHAPVCESCGYVGEFGLGVSHIISVNDCVNDPTLPVELAWDDRNMTLECHHQVFAEHLSCHQVTETKRETSYHLKLRQKNLDKKLRLYKQYKPWLYEDLMKLL